MERSGPRPTIFDVNADSRIEEHKVNVIVLKDVPPVHGQHVDTEDVGFTRPIVGLTIHILTGRTSDHPSITFSGR